MAAVFVFGGAIFIMQRANISADIMTEVGCSAINLDACLPSQKQAILAQQRLDRCNNLEKCSFIEKLIAYITAQFYGTSNVLQLAFGELSNFDPDALTKICDAAELRAKDIEGASEISGQTVLAQEKAKLREQITKCKELAESAKVK